MFVWRRLWITAFDIVCLPHLFRRVIVSSNKNGTVQKKRGTDLTIWLDVARNTHSELLQSATSGLAPPSMRHFGFCLRIISDTSVHMKCTKTVKLNSTLSAPFHLYDVNFLTPTTSRLTSSPFEGCWCEFLMSLHWLLFGLQRQLAKQSRRLWKRSIKTLTCRQSARSLFF